MLVCPLKYLLSAPTHMEWMPRHTSLQRFFGIEIFSLLIIGHEFFLAQLVEILHDRDNQWASLAAVIGAVGDAEPGIQL